jgi:hypothetical protein
MILFKMNEHLTVLFIRTVQSKRSKPHVMIVRATNAITLFWDISCIKELILEHS